MSNGLDLDQESAIVQNHLPSKKRSSLLTRILVTMTDHTFLDVGRMIIHRSNQLIAFNKPPGLAVQGKEKPDLHQLANAYAKRRLYLVHRIDQPASGVVLMAKNKSAATEISKQFTIGKIKRSYWAVVKKRPKRDCGQLQFDLAFNRKHNKSYVGQRDPRAKPSTLRYQYLCSSDHYHLLKVTIDSGRHHQIRAMLAHIGSPIKGDVKYGDRRSNTNRSIHLHAYQLEFKHPISQDPISIIAPVPDEVLWQYFAAQLS